MSKKTTVFGFNTKDLSTLNKDLAKCNDGKIPSPSEVKNIQIFFSGGILEVHVELYRFFEMEN